MSYTNTYKFFAKHSEMVHLSDLRPLTVVWAEQGVANGRFLDKLPRLQPRLAVFFEAVHTHTVALLTVKHNN